MTFDSRSLKIYIDCSPINNSVAGGIVGWLEFPAEWQEPDEELFANGLPDFEPDKKALEACILAYRYVYEKAYDRDLRRILLITDASYIHRNFFRAEAWRRNGWKKLDGGEVEYQVFWESFLWIRTKVGLRTDLEWTFGKKSPFVKAASEKVERVVTDPPTLQGFYKALEMALSYSVGTSPRPYSDGQSSELVRVYKSPSIVGGHYKICFALFPDRAAEEERLHFFALATREVATTIKARRMYKLTFHPDPQCPVIVKAEEVSIAGSFKRR